MWPRDESAWSARAGAMEKTDRKAWMISGRRSSNIKENESVPTIEKYLTHLKLTRPVFNMEQIIYENFTKHEPFSNQDAHANDEFKFDGWNTTN